MKSFFLALSVGVAAMVAGSVLAEDGLVVTKDTYLFKEVSRAKDSDKTICPLSRGNALLPSSDNPGSRHVIVDYCFWFHWCATNLKEGLDPARFSVITFVGGKFQKGWVPKDAVARFTWTPEFHSVRCSDSVHSNVVSPASYEHAATMKLDELAFSDFKPPKIENTFAFDEPVAKVWPAIIEALSDAQAPFELVDKQSGLITTKPIPDPLKNTMACATAFDEANMVKFNIFVKDKGTSTDVKINASFSAVREGTAIHCYSNGTLETWLVTGVKKVLGTTGQ